MNFLKIAVVMLMASGLILSACSPATTNLDGSSWILSSLAGKTPIYDATISLAFAAGNASGSDGCNRFNGSFTQKNNNLKIGPDMVSTMMACDDTIMQQASAFQAMIPLVETFKVDKDTLYLIDVDGNELAVFTKQNTQLSGTSWMVTGFNNSKQAVTSVLQGSEITVNFKKDGTIDGNAGCNIFSGNYLTEGTAVSVRNIESTEKACSSPEGVMDQEVQFLIALNSVKTYHMEGTKLEFHNADDAIALTLINK